MTYIHWAWCFLYEFTWSCYSTSVTPMSHSWVTTLNDQWGKSKSCHIIWSHASCSCAVTVYSHSQLTVLLPPHRHTHTHVLYTHTFSDAKENLLRWRQPLWINSAAPYRPESFTISSGECAQQLWWHREQKVLKELLEEGERIITRLWGSYHLSQTIFLLSWRWTNLLLAHFSYILSGSLTSKSWPVLKQSFFTSKFQNSLIANVMVFYFTLTS